MIVTLVSLIELHGLKSIGRYDVIWYGDSRLSERKARECTKLFILTHDSSSIER